MGALDGKVAIVTGAGHGVGRGHALALAEAGAKVVVNDLGGSTRGEGADTSVAQAVVDVIRARGGEAVANASNVADFDDAGAMVQQALDTYGRLDVLVCNAGILRDRMIFSMDESEWDAVIAVHLKGHFAPIRHATAHWREASKQAGGPVNASIVTTASTVGWLGNPSQANYAAAKAGITMLTVNVALEMERYGVRANCVAPSGTTRLIAAAVPGRADVEVKEPDEYEEWSPRDPGNVAPLVVWLASDLSANVTGQLFFSHGPHVTRFLPFQADTRITVPGGQGKWDVEELNRAMSSVVFGTRHPGLFNGANWAPERSIFDMGG